MGQAIVFNGLGAISENYNNFLGKTSALYNGTISPQLYRDSLTSFIGSGTSNQRSFDCVRRASSAGAAGEVIPPSGLVKSAAR